MFKHKHGHQNYNHYEGSLRIAQPPEEQAGKFQPLFYAACERTKYCREKFWGSQKRKGSRPENAAEHTHEPRQRYGQEGTCTLWTPAPLLSSCMERKKESRYAR